jgi:hypothetical protein
VRNGTAKFLTLFCPRGGEMRARGVTHTTDAVLYSWQQGLQVRITLSPVLPPLHLLLVWDNLQGHWTPVLIGWLFSHGVMPLYTPRWTGPG